MKEQKRPEFGWDFHGHGPFACHAPGLQCCRNFGTVSTVGVYAGLLDNIPTGSAISRGLTFRMAQTAGQVRLPRLLEHVEKGDIDPSFVITHRAPLEDGPNL